MDMQRETDKIYIECMLLSEQAMVLAIQSLHDHSFDANTFCDLYICSCGATRTGREMQHE